MQLEAFLLTGGASRRMGSDKAALPVDGIPMAQRIADMLSRAGVAVTILGRAPIEGFAFVADAQEFQGPVATLRAAAPSAPLAFVASCDLARFDARIVDVLAARLGDSEAAVPVVEGRLQPLCALYRQAAFDRLDGCQSMMSWLDRLAIREVTAEEMIAEGIQPLAVLGANTPEDFRRLRAGESP